MEVAMAARGWAVMSPATFSSVSASCASRPSKQSLTSQRKIGFLKPLKDRIADIQEEVFESRATPSSFRQSSSIRNGCSEEEERPGQSGHAQESRAESATFQRRVVMGKGIALLMSALSFPALATEEEFKLYQDKDDKFSLLVPQEWTQGGGNAGVRKVTAFYPESDSSANVSIVITGLGADYTALGSFGTVDIFAENLVNSLDRAWQRPKGQAAKLVDSRSKNGMYYIEYTIQKPGEGKRHLLSVVGIASNGWINRLFTVTGQFWEDDGDKYKANLQKVVLIWPGGLPDEGVHGILFPETSEELGEMMFTSGAC